MRAVVQRVSSAEVAVDGRTVGAIRRGFLVLLGVDAADSEDEVHWMAEKVAHLRVFPDEDGRMNRSLLDVGGEALVVSQFTLLADVSRGRRPSFAHAARPEYAEPMYERFCAALAGVGVRSVAQGVFGARMAVSLVNDGPVTFVVDTAPAARFSTGDPQ
jgi:D-tyrosyl-tRNA(Tyr) deacylase